MVYYETFINFRHTLQRRHVCSEIERLCIAAITRSVKF